MLADLLEHRYKNKSGIVYVHSKNECQNVTAALMERGILVAAYHAGLPIDQRTEIHQQWLSGGLQAVVATIAFGM